MLRLPNYIKTGGLWLPSMNLANPLGRFGACGASCCQVYQACPPCYVSCPDELTVDISGLANHVCDACTDLNDTYVLAYSNGTSGTNYVGEEDSPDAYCWRAWSYLYGGFICGNGRFASDMRVTAITYWYLFLGHRQFVIDITGYYGGVPMPGLSWMKDEYSQTAPWDISSWVDFEIPPYTSGLGADNCYNTEPALVTAT